MSSNFVKSPEPRTNSTLANDTVARQIHRIPKPERKYKTKSTKSTTTIRSAQVPNTWRQGQIWINDNTEAEHKHLQNSSTKSAHITGWQSQIRLKSNVKSNKTHSSAAAVEPKPVDSAKSTMGQTRTRLGFRQTA